MFTQREQFGKYIAYAFDGCLCHYEKGDSKIIMEKYYGVMLKGGKQNVN